MSSWGIIIRYLFSRGSLDESGRPKTTSYILSLILLALTVVIFYFLGRQDVSRPAILAIIILTAWSAGSVNGFLYLANSRLIKVGDTPASLNLWLQVASSLVIGVVLGLTTILPFYLGALSSGIDTLLVVKLTGIVLAVTLASGLLGNMIFILIRRITKSAIIRTLLAVGVIILVWRLLGSLLGALSKVDVVMTNPNFSATAYLILGLLGITGFTLVVLELLFINQTIRSRPIPDYWQLTLGERALGGAFSAGPAAFGSEFLRLIRGATWQRSLIFYWLLLIGIIVLLKNFMSDSPDQGRLILYSSYLSAVAAGLLVSYRSGQEFLKKRNKFNFLPQKNSTMYLAFFSSSGVIALVVSFFFASFAFLAGSLDQTSNYLTFGLVTLIFHLVFFNLGVVGEQRARIINFFYLAVFAALIALIPSLYYQIVPTYVTISILTIWLLTLWLTSRYYLNQALENVR